MYSTTVLTLYSRINLFLPLLICLRVTDCVSQSRHLVERSHCSAQGSATLGVPSTRLVMRPRQSVDRLPASTGPRGVACVDRVGRWTGHVVVLWIDLDHVLVPSTEVCGFVIFLFVCLIIDLFFTAYKNAEHLYSALHGIQTTLKRSGMDHTV